MNELSSQRQHLHYLHLDAPKQPPFRSPDASTDSANDASK